MTSNSDLFLTRVQLASQMYWRSKEADGDRRLSQALELIEDCYTDAISLDDIALASHYSPHHFHRLFRARYGITPHQLVTKRRMQRAQQLLDHTSLSVTEVCFEVGFESLGSFSSAFRKYSGYSPSRYRRRMFHVGWDPLTQIPACLYLIWGCGKFSGKNRKIEEVKT